jgi:hypothetical protein
VNRLSKQNLIDLIPLVYLNTYVLSLGLPDLIPLVYLNTYVLPLGLPQATQYPQKPTQSFSLMLHDDNTQKYTYLGGLYYIKISRNLWYILMREFMLAGLKLM